MKVTPVGVNSSQMRPVPFPTQSLKPGTCSPVMSREFGSFNEGVSKLAAKKIAQ